MEVARAAEAKVDADGSKNLFRKAGRGTQKYATSMRRMIDLVPGGDYTSALCGGLKIAFDVSLEIWVISALLSEYPARLPPR